MVAAAVYFDDYGMPIDMPNDDTFDDLDRERNELITTTEAGPLLSEFAAVRLADILGDADDQRAGGGAPMSDPDATATVVDSVTQAEAIVRSLETDLDLSLTNAAAAGAEGGSNDTGGADIDTLIRTFLPTRSKSFVKGKRPLSTSESLPTAAPPPTVVVVVAPLQDPLLAPIKAPTTTADPSTAVTNPPPPKATTTSSHINSSSKHPPRPPQDAAAIWKLLDDDVEIDRSGGGDMSSNSSSSSSLSLINRRSRNIDELQRKSPPPSQGARGPTSTNTDDIPPSTTVAMELSDL